MNNLSGSLSFHGDVSGQMGANLIPSVEANPSGTATEILTSIRVGDIIYSIPSGGGGGGGGTNNYNDLLNKPKINNVILSGELSLSELGIYNPVVMTGATSSADGAAGYAPKPLIADKDKFLKGDGTWADPASGGSNITNLYTNNNTSNPSSITLSDDITNYDLIIVNCIRTADGIPRSIVNNVFLVSNITIGSTINLLGWAGNNEYILYTLSTNNTLSLTVSGNNIYIDSIDGIKL